METVDKTKTDVVDDKPQVVNADLRKFNRSEQMVTKAVTALMVITIIATKEECDSALVTLKEASTVDKAIEKKRTELVKPFNDAVKKINNYAKELIAKLPPEIDRVKKVVVGFQLQEERKAAKKRYDTRVVALVAAGFQKVGSWWFIDEERAMLDDFVMNADVESYNAFLASKIEHINQCRLQRNASQEDDMLFGTDEEVTEALLGEVTIPVAATVSTETAKVKGITKRWTFEITDPSLVTREYLVVDEKKIREAVSAGTRSIPGVRIYEDTSLTIR
jgi:hypothetical protein